MRQREMIVDVKGLTKLYKNGRGIQDINFTINKGETFGFIGPNGAGKSTTIRTLLGLLQPTSGEFTIFGKCMRKERTKILEHVGYLPAEVYFYSEMKVKDLFRYAASFYHGVDSKYWHDLSDYLELDIHSKIADLSLGNKKKVGIIQGLLHQPELIILDEPTNGLDPLMQQKFFNLLEKEQQKGTTILFSSHILSEVQKLCHRVGIIKDGRLIENMAMDELTHQMYKKVKIVVANVQHLQQISLPGMQNVVRRGKNEVEFLYNGPIQTLIDYIVLLPVSDLSIMEPDLEDVFMHYYE